MTWFLLLTLAGVWIYIWRDCRDMAQQKENDDAMKRYNFVVRYETRSVVVNGVAHVIGDYDGPDKPEAMVREALADCDNLKVILSNNPDLTGDPPPDE